MSYRVHSQVRLQPMSRTFVTQTTCPSNIALANRRCQVSRLGGVIQVTLAGGNPQLEPME